jgi:hypothetical protein
MVEQDSRMLDVFTCRVGGLAPGEEATVRLTYMLSLEDEEDQVRCCLSLGDRDVRAR